jgi:hypothetical protein
LDAEQLAQIVAGSIDDDLGCAGLNLNGADHAAQGGAGIHLQVHDAAEQAVGLCELLVGAQAGHIRLHGPRLFQGAELGHLGDKIRVLGGIERILRGHLRHQKTKKIVLAQGLDGHTRGGGVAEQGGGVVGGVDSVDRHGFRPSSANCQEQRPRGRVQVQVSVMSS